MTKHIRMPAYYRQKYKGRITKKMDRLLFGTSGFKNLMDALCFARLFITILENEYGYQPWNRDTFVQRHNYMTKEADTRKLARWFLSRLVLRLGKHPVAEAECFAKWGISDEELAEILLFQATSRYWYGSSLPEPGQYVPEKWFYARGSCEDDTEEDEENEIYWLYSDYGSTVTEPTDGFLPPDEWHQDQRLLMVLDNRTNHKNRKLALKCMPFQMMLWLCSQTDSAQRICPRAMLPPNPHDLESQRDRIFSDIRRQGVHLSTSPGAPPFPVPSQLSDSVIWEGESVILKMFKTDDDNADCYRVDLRRGQIHLRQHGCEWEERPDLYFAFRRCRTLSSLYYRGKKDIISIFAKQLGCAFSESFVNQDACWEHIARFVQRLVTRMLNTCNAGAMQSAKRQADRPGQQWAAYSIACRHGMESTELFRIREFADTFPALFRVMPHDRVLRTIATGQSLRRQCMWWSKYYRRAASQPVTSYMEAQSFLLVGIAETYGVTDPGLLTIINIEHVANIVGLYPGLIEHVHPFKLAFWLWAVERWRNDDADYGLIREFWWDVRFKNHSITIESRYRLNKLFNEWLNRQFPDPVVPDYKDDSYVINYIRNSLELRELGDEMENCVYSYRNKIYRGESQIYIMREKESNDGIATLEIKPDRKGGYALVQATGPNNDGLAEEHAKIMESWAENFDLTIDLTE